MFKMPHSDQKNGKILHNRDSIKSAIMNKSSLKPLDLKEISPSQEQDPNFSYERDKSAVDVTSVVDKFLNPCNGNVLPDTHQTSNHISKSPISDTSQNPETVLRKRKPVICESLDKETKITSDKTLDSDKRKTPSAETNGYPEINSQKSGCTSDILKIIKTDLHIRKLSISESNGQTISLNDFTKETTEINRLKLDSTRHVNVKNPPDRHVLNGNEIQQTYEEEEKCKLLVWEDMPRHLQFNPYVKTGYRPLLSAWGCVNSLFYIHNETVNILTHGIPIIYIICVVPKLLPWESDAGFPFLAWCHLAGALAPWCGSFLYHLFMNTSRGAQAYNRLLQLDMLGIWVSQSFGALPLLAATTFCMPWLVRWIIITSYSLLSMWGLYKALTAWSPWERRLCFLLPFTMRAILAWFRAGGMVGGNPSAISHIILQDAISAIGGVIGAVNIPERWFPGMVDMFLNSHNIMHVLVVTAVYFMHQATVLDIMWMSEGQCERQETTPDHAGDIIPNVVYQL